MGNWSTLQWTTFQCPESPILNLPAMDSFQIRWVLFPLAIVFSCFSLTSGIVRGLSTYVSRIIVLLMSQLQDAWNRLMSLKKFLMCESHLQGVVYELLKCHIFILSICLVTLNQRENASLHLIHMCNVIDTVKTFFQTLKALLWDDEYNYLCCLCSSLWATQEKV